MGATRMDVPGARRVHLTLLFVSVSVRVSSVSFWMVHASSVMEIVDDSYEQADAERCSTSRMREEA